MMDNVLTIVKQVVLTEDHKSAQSSLDAFKFGLLEGLFKYQPRANSNCLTDGAIYLHALKQLSLRFLHNHFKVSDQEQFSFEDVYISTMHKCMIQDTLQGTAVLNLGVFIINSLKPEQAQYFEQLHFLFRVVDLLGLANGAAEAFYQVNVMIYKDDAYNFGKFFGKVIKIFTQFQLINYTGSAHYLYDAPLATL